MRTFGGAHSSRQKVFQVHLRLPVVFFLKYFALPEKTVVRSQLCALPVCVDKRFDRGNDDKPRIGVLADAIEMLINELNLWTENQPRCVLISTSQTALLEWTSMHMPRQKWDEFSEVFKQSTLDDKIPAVFACGFEKTGDSPKWIFE
jgi:hypothetical protein